MQYGALFVVLISLFSMVEASWELQASWFSGAGGHGPACFSCGLCPSSFQVRLCGWSMEDERTWCFPVYFL